ncbi:hypothetical protein DI14_09155 [Exiguobacterium sp. AB2]|nr:hypothetical protein DI14_09155 [Exiguobacterium sp. AB2]
MVHLSASIIYDEYLEFVKLAVIILKNNVKYESPAHGNAFFFLKITTDCCRRSVSFTIMNEKILFLHSKNQPRDGDTRAVTHIYGKMGYTQ